MLVVKWFQLYSNSLTCFDLFVFVRTKKNTLNSCENLSNFQPVNSHLSPFRAFLDDVCTKNNSRLSWSYDQMIIRSYDYTGSHVVHVMVWSYHDIIIWWFHIIRYYSGTTVGKMISYELLCNAHLATFTTVPIHTIWKPGLFATRKNPNLAR